MKIVLFIYSMHCGGAERVTANLANEWASLGWQVTVVTLTTGEDDFYPLHPQVQRVALGLAGRADSFVGTVAANIRRVIAFRRVLRSVQPAVALGIMTTASVLAILAGFGLACKVIATEHTHPPRLPLTPFWKRLRRWTFPAADKVVALTEESRQWLEEHCHCTGVKVIPPPFSLPIARTSPIVAPECVMRRERRMLLGVGRLSPEKGFDYLIGAFERIAGQLPEWDLVIVGEGPARAALEEQIEKAGLGARAFLPGQVGNVSDWYERADLYVLSSRFEGFSMTLVEAMASGCAAVSYDCDAGPRDIIQHGANGLLVHPVGDTRKLADALCGLMKDGSGRDRMAQRAIAVGETFALSKTVALWQQVFEESGVRFSSASIAASVAERGPHSIIGDSKGTSTCSRGAVQGGSAK